MPGRLTHNTGMLLIFPPVAKACEPPPGIARLAATLHAHSIPCQLLDANLEAQLWLMKQPVAGNDTWSRRACRNRAANLARVRDAAAYQSPDRYSRAVKDLNRLLATAGTGSQALVTLADYQHRQLSPLRSSDLLQAAAQYRRDPFFPYFSERLRAIIEHGGLARGIVGFSLNYLNQALCCFAMAGFVRDNFPGLTIVLGGGLVTSWLSRPGWSNPFSGLIDHLIAGPGESALLALAGTGRTSDTPPPDYAALPLDDYLAPGLILPYSAASGCYWNRCSFCPEQAEGNRYHPLPASRAVDQLRQLSSATAPALIHILDNAVSPALLRALLGTPPGAPWYGFVRFIPELLDQEFCDALRRAGCVMLKLGLESGDQRVLDRLSKGIDIGMAGRILTNLERAGIGTYIYLLFGTPAETELEARQTLEFIRQHRQQIGFLNLALFNMPRNSEQALSLAAAGSYDGDLSLYTDFHHPRGWDRRQVRMFLEKEFKRDPAVAAIIKRSPPLFGSNHAPFFTGSMQSGCVRAPWPGRGAHPHG